MLLNIATFLQSVLYHFVAFNNFIKRKKIIYLPAILKAGISVSLYHLKKLFYFVLRYYAFLVSLLQKSTPCTFISEVNLKT